MDVKDQLARKMADLSHLQLKYLSARVKTRTKKEAANLVNIPHNTVYGWGDTVDQVYDLMMIDSVNRALTELDRWVIAALQVKVEGLTFEGKNRAATESEKIRQSAATEILDRVLGKPIARSIKVNHKQILIKKI